VSERTSQLVDAEVTRLLNDSYARAKQTLIDNRDLLERMAEALLERETLTADDAAMLVQGTPLPPRKSGAPPSVPVPVTPGVVVQPKPARPGLLGGPEVAPA
jgi:cell division protease FtsH